MQDTRSLFDLAGWPLAVGLLLLGCEGSSVLHGKDAGTDVTARDLTFSDKGAAADGLDSGSGSCSPAGSKHTCVTSFPGVCAEGNGICLEDGVWSGCEPTIQLGAQAEHCDNGQDDDCDGQADAADPDCTACTPGASESCAVVGALGECANGTHVCTAGGTWGVCSGSPPRAEDCANGLDDDCDGVFDATDPDCTACTSGESAGCTVAGARGVCALGIHVCLADGTWGACTGPAPQSETCTNGLDDDCDGVPDATDPDCFECTAGQAEPCTAAGAQGICTNGSRTCTSAGSWSTCTPGAAQSENCANGLDDDCDGPTDGADSDCFACSPGSSEPCTVAGQQGVCVNGTHTCDAAGQWTPCAQQIFPSSEICCTATDEDCDGTAGSDDLDCHNCPMGATGASCPAGLAGTCGNGTRNCVYQAASCTYEWSACLPPTGSETNPVTNKCNGVDDDCDGTIDEGTNLEGRVRLMEIFPQAIMTQLGLGAESGILFMNWDGHTSGYHAAWGLTSSRMLSAGDAAATRILFNNNLGGIDLFQTESQVASTDSAMFVPTGGLGVTANHLFFFIDGVMRGVNLSTMQVSQAPISDLYIPSGSGYLASNITAATFIAASDWAAGSAGFTDLALVVSSGEAWGYCDGCAGAPGFAWGGPYTNPTELFGPGISAYLSSFSQIDSLAVWREPGAQAGLLAMTTTAGQILYTPLDSSYGTWSALAIMDFSCQQ